MEEQKRQNVVNHSLEYEFVTYEQALALNELGYDGDYNYTYDIKKELWYGDIKADGEKYIASPLKQQVFRWFREKYDLFSYIFPWIRRVGWGYDIPNESSAVKQTNNNTFTSYEEAENDCIDKLIELVK